MTLENEIMIDSSQLTDITYIKKATPVYSNVIISDQDPFFNRSIVVSNFTFTNVSDVPSNSIKPMSAEGKLIN